MKGIRSWIPWIGMILVGILLIAHLRGWEWVEVDTTALILLAAFLLLPFLDQLKRIKIGDVEAEIGTEEVQNAVESVKRELGPETPEVLPPGKREPLILTLTRDDPQLGLAKLRIELERALKALVRVSDVAPGGRGHPSVTRMAGALQLAGVLPDEVAGAIDDIVPLANRAVHGERVRSADAQELAELGVRVLEELKTLYDDWVSEVKKVEQLSSSQVTALMDARYRVETVVPLVSEPYRNVRELNQDGLTSLLEGYEEYGEFIVRVERIE